MSKITFYIKPDKSTSDEEMEFIREKYGNHSTFHEGDAGLDLFCPQDLSIPSGQIAYKINLGINCELKDESGNNLPYLLMPRSSTGSKSSLRMSNSLGLIDAGYRGPLCACVDNIEAISVINRSYVYLETIDFTLILSLITSFCCGNPDNVHSDSFLWFSILALHFLLLHFNNISGSIFPNGRIATHEVEQGDRLFQLVPLVSGSAQLECKVVEELSETTRGEGGFGSTGKGDGDEADAESNGDGDSAENVTETEEDGYGKIETKKDK